MGSLDKIRYLCLRHEMLRRMEHGLGRGCGPRLYMACVIVAVLILLFGCSTLKGSLKERSDTKDSVIIEYVEKIREVPVTVYVEVPPEEKQRETRDTVSHLTTRFADSWAKIQWRDGDPFLFHSLANIPQKIEKQDSVPVKETVRTEWRTRRVAYTKTVFVEREPAWWQKFLMWSGAIAWVMLVVWIVIKAVKRAFPRPKC